MSRIYAVAMDTFNHCRSLRNAYIIARGPYDTMDDAIQASDEAVSELAGMYHCLESETTRYYTKKLEDGTNFLMMRKFSECTPIARFTIFEVDPKRRTSYRKGGINASFKKGSETQMIEKKKIRKLNQYIASQVPAKLTSEELKLLKQED